MPGKILIIEDTADIADALKALLELRGHEVVVAGDGYDGCVKARELRPGLILMDLALPGMNGLEATREIRSQSGGSVTPIVIVSSYAGGHEAELREAGCDEVLSKTSFLESLDEILEKYLGGSRRRIRKD